MSEKISPKRSGFLPAHFFSAQSIAHSRLTRSNERSAVTGLPNPDERTHRISPIDGIIRRWRRERRRRKVGRAYDMALEIARAIPHGSKVLDVGCGNGFIAHHLSAMLESRVIGVDVGSSTSAPIDYRPYDGTQFPVADHSVDAVLFCYVLHHAQDVAVVLSEARRVLRDDGLVVVYEDIPGDWWDKQVCWFHDRQWRERSGPCTFRLLSEWRSLFDTSGLEIVSERSLSRWRNLAHPVSRRFYVLRRRPAAH